MNDEKCANKLEVLDKVDNPKTILLIWTKWIIISPWFNMWKHFDYPTEAQMVLLLHYIYQLRKQFQSYTTLPKNRKKEKHFLSLILKLKKGSTCECTITDQTHLWTDEKTLNKILAIKQCIKYVILTMGLS